jgi:DNA-binding NtrC family response regulator
MTSPAAASLTGEEVVLGTLALKERPTVPADVGDELIGDSPAMQRVRQQIERLADLPASVLIVGESGVGKELVAARLHRRSNRRAGPLVAVNCAAIVQTMPEAQLFGHEKGSFTGADRARPGYFQHADLGTLFLDEIGELSLDCQAKLLRALETRSFYPVGAIEPVTVDVRFVAATNRNLERETREKRFRPDLLYRLGLVIEVPPLRERPEDIPQIAEYLLRREAERYRRQATLSESALHKLQKHPWPGNVRELRMALDYALAMSDGTVLHAGDLRLRSTPESEPDEPTPSLNLEDLEAWAIRKALARTGGNNTKAALVLGIHRDTLLQKLRKYGISRE